MLNTKQMNIKKLRPLTLFASLLFILFSIANIFGFAGEVDSSFNVNIARGPAERARVTVIQPDGRIITHGVFDSLNGDAVPNLVRLNVDGSTDTSFTPDEITPTVTNSGLGIRSIALQSDGKILIGGVFSSIGGQTAYSFARLNSNGTRDTSFVFDSETTNFRDVNDIIVLPDDSFLIVDRAAGLFKFNADGSSDASFHGGTNCGVTRTYITLQPDGKILKAGGGSVERCNTDGTLDSSFTSPTLDGIIYEVSVQNDGKILVGGNYTLVNGFNLPKLSRYNSDGSVDTTFTHNFSTTGYITKIVPLSDGTIFVAGDVLSNSAAAQNNNIYKLTSSGSIDSSFNPVDQNGEVWDLDIQTDGKILRSSIQRTTEINQAAKIINRLNSDGTEDSNFSPIFGKSARGFDVFVQPDGKILVGGDFSLVNSDIRNGLVRFNSDGTVDTSFNGNFANFLDGSGVRGLDVQPDGKIIVGFYFSPANARRLNVDGTLDVEFFESHNARDVKVLSNGKILIAGGSYLRLYNSNGGRDNSFSATVNAAISRFVIQPDGKIIIVGEFTVVNGSNRGRIARLNSDGTLDNSFNPSGGANEAIDDVGLQSDGKIIIGGQFTGVNFENRQYLARLNSNGSLDTSFTTNPNATVSSVKVQTDDRILVGGYFNLMNGSTRTRLARLNSNGTIDNSFNTNISLNNSGPPNVRAIDIQSDGNILIVGEFSRVGGESHLGIARILNTTAPSSTDYDFDGDGKADIAVFRPSENKWYVLRSSDFGVTQQIFAVGGDTPVPSDFDGDGQTDFSIFRNSMGDWWSLASGSGSQVFAHLGADGDIPRPSDFDGDGRADYVVYRPSDFTWYRTSSSNGAVSNKQFGAAGDKPLIGDFDGDGKSDVAIFRPSTGDWWWQSSVDNGQRAVHWGAAGDIPSPGDYDGDGITDFTIYRPSEGLWYILNSSSGNTTFTIQRFGIAEDKPVPADYDGDGKTDIALFRPSTGVWYLLQSTNGFAAYNFGISTDIPVPNSFIP